MLRFADLPSLPPVQPERRLCRSRRIQQIVLPNHWWSAQQMALDVWKHGTEKSEPFVPAGIFFLCVMGRPPAIAHGDGVMTVTAAFGALSK